MKILSSSKPKANKDHVCMWCGGIIKKGEVYEKFNCTNDGDIYTWKNHIKCSKLYYALNMSEYDDGDGVGADTFMESVYEFLQDYLTKEECDMLRGEAAVDKAIEFLKSKEV